MKSKNISNLCKRILAGALAFVMAAGSLPAMNVQAETFVEVDGTADVFEAVSTESTVEMPTKDSVKFATFNIAAMTQPTEENMTAILNQLESKDIDFAGLQEVDKNTGRNAYDMLAFFQGETYTDVSYQKTIDFDGGEYGFGTISKTTIQEKTGGQLTTPAGLEQRCWQRSLVEVDGEQIAFYNTHLSYDPRNVVEAQVQELIAMMDADPAEYIVVVGDFNVDESKEILYPFLENYNLANGKDGVWYDTYNSEIGLLNNYAIDNIVTSRNIEVKSVNHEDNTLSDHDMLWVECALLDEEVVSTQYLDIVAGEAGAIDGSLYYEDTYAPVAEALAAAETLTEEATQEDVNAAAEAIAEALDGLVAIPSADTNLAYGKVAQATTYNITDGTLGYMWTGATYPTSFEIDLGEVKAVEKMVAFPYADGSRYYHYTIEVSEDGVNYVQVAEKTDTTPETDAGTAYEFEEAVNARYVKVTMTYNSANVAVHMREFEIYAADAETGELVNVALGLPALASNITHITDGNTSNYWDGGKYPGYFVVDLGYSYPVGKFVAFPYNTGSRYYNYYIEVSEDGVNYTKVAEKMDTTPEVAEGTAFELDEAVNARYVKVTMTYNNDNESVHMKEFQVYPYADSEEEPTPDPEEPEDPVVIPEGSINVAAYKNGGSADADNVTVTGGDKGFLNDGSYGNLWVAANASTPVSGWVTFDAKYLIDTVRVVFKEGENVNFTVSYYDNGAYKTLYSGTGYDEANSEDGVGHKYYNIYSLETPVVTNKIKVTVNSTDGEIPAIAEIEAYGTEYDPNKVPKNLALTGTATASYVSYGRAASRAIDGDFGSYWDGDVIGDGQWWMVDLGEECKLTELQVTTYHDAGDGRHYLYYAEVSSDGETWTKVADREETYGTAAAFRGETYTFDEEIEARYVRVTVTKNSANSIAHLKEVEVWGYPSVIRENVALGKTVSSSNADYGRGADVIVDGDYSGYWDGGSAPQNFTIDLESSYFVEEIVVTPYVDGIRYYEYYIEYSLDGSTFTKIFDRTADMGLAYVGETFTLEEPIEMRFIRITMTYNSKQLVEPDNKSVHMKEVEVYGTINPDYEAPTTDVSDPDNVAFGKNVRTHLATDSVVNINDGLDGTTCTGEFAPAYFDIDLEENYDLSEIILTLPVKSTGYYYYTIYGSVDGSNYDRLFQQRSKEFETDGVEKINLKELGLESTEYRIVRVYMEYCGGSSSAILSEVRIHGTALGTNTGDLRTGSIEDILNIKPFSETEYAAPITEDETIENVYGIVERNVGKEYRDWFTFVIAENTENENDYFTIGQDPLTGKIVITGNDGVSLASGLHYYLREFCDCLITEQTKQVNMPEEIVAVTEPVRCETPYKVRYAFNYCTLNYTFSYADYAEFVRENDWLALNGVNCVIDLAGQEAVWIKFLQNFGYSFDEAKDWIAGPSYYAWQFMDNMEVVGGPVSDEWVTGRLEMARETQRFKNSLGMQTVFQGYAGMIPCNFADFQPEVEILDQGTWCSLPRPDMIRTDGDLYDQYAELFYSAQEWAFGATSDYYAVDPFHEGGIRPDDLSDETIAKEVLDSLLKYDEDGIWMVQAWWSNPSVELLRGMGDYRQDHVIILDLTGIGSPKWDKLSYGSTTLDTIEFNGTDWVSCLLDNYGGNPSMDGNLQLVINEVVRARDTAEHMKGIGIIPEATYMNPVLYQLLFDMTWVSEDTIDLDEWLDDYVIDRYGAESENAREAWDLLKKTIYGREGHTAQVMAGSGSLNKYGLPYDSVKAEEALELLFKDYDKLSASESYRYDLSELMRQIVNNYAVVKLGQLKDAYDAADVETFNALKEEYLANFDLLELVLGTQQELLVGDWIGGAEDWAINTGADDFAYDSMVINAKTIITVWAPSSYLGAYAYRNYEGMFKDLYKPMWEAYLNRQAEILETGASDISLLGYTKSCMEWIYADQDYTRKADNSVENVKYVTQRVIDECSTDVPLPDYPENEGNVALGKEVTATHERPDSPGAPGGGYAEHITDGRPETYWDGIEWAYSPEAVIDLEAKYDINRINVLCYVAGSRYYQYDLYASNDGENWTQILNGTSTDPEVDAGKDYTFEDLTARYIKIVGTYNSSNEGFHVKEVRVYGEEAVEPEVIGAEHITLTASSVDETEAGFDKSPEKVLDNDNTTFWATVPDGTLADAWLQAEFDQVYEISQVDYSKRYDAGEIWNCTGNLFDYIIEVSTDGENWTQVAAGDTVDGTTAITFDAVEAKYVRLKATESYHWQESSANTVMTVADLAFYGVAVETEEPEVVDKSALQALVDECAALDASLYTEESVAAVLLAATDANAVLASEDATQADVDAAVAALTAAKEALVERTLTGISVATAPKAEYTEGEVFDPAGLVLTLTYDNNTTATVAYGEDNAADFGFAPDAALTTADTVVTITYAGKETTVAITVAAAVSETDPADDSKDVPVEMYTATAGSTQPGGSTDLALDGNSSTFWEVAWDIGNTNPELLWYQIELEDEVEIEAVRYLPRWGGDAGNINGFITQYLIEVSTDGENWTTVAEGTWERTEGWKIAEFEAVTAKYVRITGVGTYADVGDNSNMSIAEIRVKATGEVINKAALKAAIAEAEGLTAEGYVDFSAVEVALAAAKEVVANADATQEEVDAAAESLNAAIDALEEVVPPVTKDALAEAIAAAEAVDGTLYTEESYAAVTEALAAAEAVYADEAATQEEVDAAVKAIEDAIDALEVPVVEEDEVVRISGTTRYETGYKVADALKEELGVEKFDAVVVATGKNFADALAGSYLAVRKDAPIILTNGSDDNVAALHEYIAANVAAGGKVYILGGEGAVPASVAAIDGYDVVRLSGKTRYETNLAILAEAGIEGTELIVATGKTFADSLSASAAKLPILLVKPETALTDEAKAIAEGMNKFYIIGGEGAVSADIEAELAAYGEVVRVSGKTRYETSVAVANTFFADVEAAVVANGKNFPDGLCGGPLAAAMDAPLILTADGKTDAAAAYMADNAIASGFVLGGTGALADETVVDVFALESAEEIILK